LRDEVKAFNELELAVGSDPKDDEPEDQRDGEEGSQAVR
jgi:hypothetical protein